MFALYGDARRGPGDEGTPAPPVPGGDRRQHPGAVLRRPVARAPRTSSPSMSRWRVSGPRSPASDRDFATAMRSVIATAGYRRGHGYRRGSARSACPVLLLHGRRDRLVPVSGPRARRRAANPAWTLVVLPGVGHVPQLEARGAVRQGDHRVARRGGRPALTEAGRSHPGRRVARWWARRPSRRPGRVQRGSAANAPTGPKVRASRERRRWRKPAHPAQRAS